MCEIFYEVSCSVKLRDCSGGHVYFMKNWVGDRRLVGSLEERFEEDLNLNLHERGGFGRSVP